MGNENMLAYKRIGNRDSNLNACKEIDVSVLMVHDDDYEDTGLVRDKIISFIKMNI